MACVTKIAQSASFWLCATRFPHSMRLSRSGRGFVRFGGPHRFAVMRRPPRRKSCGCGRYFRADRPHSSPIRDTRPAEPRSMALRFIRGNAVHRVAMTRRQSCPICWNLGRPGDTAPVDFLPKNIMRTHTFTGPPPLIPYQGP